MIPPLAPPSQRERQLLRPKAATEPSIVKLCDIHFSGKKNPRVKRLGVAITAGNAVLN